MTSPTASPTAPPAAPPGAPPAVASPPARGRWRWLLQGLNLLALLLLLLLFMSYVVTTRQEPFYGWVAGTPVETLCLQLVPFLNRQHHRWQNQAREAPLLPEERTTAAALLARMDEIRPTHLVVLKDGRRLCGRLHQARGQTERLSLVTYAQGEFTPVPLAKSDILHRQAIIFPDDRLTAKDIRFLLRYRDYDHYFLPPYVYATRRDFVGVQEVHIMLLMLDEEYRGALAPLLADGQGGTHCHVALFGEDDYRREATAAESYNLVNSVGFFRKSENTFFLFDPLRPPRNRDDGVPDARLTGGAALAVVRHEGAHQLAAALGVLPSGQTAPFWLEEGLAQYWETVPGGGPLPAKLTLLRQALAQGRLLAWDKLLALRPADLEHDERLTDLAYAQSWLLCHLLLGPKYRAGFFGYILDWRREGAPGAGADPTIRLMNSLRTTASKLDEEFKAELVAAP